jgi:hypothetical protein
MGWLFQGGKRRGKLTFATDGKAGMYILIAKGLKKPAKDTQVTMKIFFRRENTSRALPDQVEAGRWIAPFGFWAFPDVAREGDDGGE